VSSAWHLFGAYSIYSLALSQSLTWSKKALESRHGTKIGCEGFMVDKLWMNVEDSAIE